MKTSLALTLLALTLSAPSLAADAFREGPRAILPMQQTAKPVEFDHLRHQQLDCQQCHHPIAKGQESFTPYKCASCHSTDGKDRQLSNSYFQIIHGKQTSNDDPSQRCLACHLEAEQRQPHAASTQDLTSCANSSCHQ